VADHVRRQGLQPGRQVHRRRRQVRVLLIRRQFCESVLVTIYLPRYW
jgi:hypothetical protein